MKIPKEVRDAVKAAEEAKRFGKYLALTRPACWKELGKLSQNHAHDADGKCILHNHSRDEVHKSPTGGVWIRRTK